jgi:predicted transcriptional regulator
MVESTTAAENLRASRTYLGISQSRLARLSGVSRFKICTYELGDDSLRPEEQNRIREALQVEAERLRAIPAGIASGLFQSANSERGGPHDGVPISPATERL